MSKEGIYFYQTVKYNFVLLIWLQPYDIAGQLLHNCFYCDYIGHFRYIFR